MTGSIWRSVCLFVLVVTIAACGGESGLEITNARLAVPAGPNAALYFTASDSETDVLVGARTAVADSVEIHQVVMGEDGTMGMQPLDSLEVTADEDLVLSPGVMHLMLINADRLVEGDEITVTLQWEKAGDVSIQVPVVAPQDAVDEGG